MTNGQLKKAQTISAKISHYKDHLKEIRRYERRHNDYPLKLGLLYFSPNILESENIYSFLFLDDKKIKKDVLNLIKTYYVSEIQKMEKELEEL